MNAYFRVHRDDTGTPVQLEEIDAEPVVEAGDVVGYRMLHDADEVVGRITTRGQWDRRYRIRRDEPKVDPMREVAKVLGLTIFILAMWVVIFVYVAIAGAAR